MTRPPLKEVSKINAKLMVEMLMGIVADKHYDYKTNIAVLKLIVLVKAIGDIPEDEFQDAVRLRRYITRKLNYIQENIIGVHDSK